MHLVQFDDVFFAVDQRQRAAVVPPADVARAEPAFPVKRLERVLLVLVVALEHVVTTNTNFADV